MFCQLRHRPRIAILPIAIFMVFSSPGAWSMIGAREREARHRKCEPAVSMAIVRAVC
jgi:hypothetical protein